MAVITANGAIMNVEPKSGARRWKERIMKASDMTNEELAKALMRRVPLDSNNYDDIREASARLRRLKIAEDALDKVYKCIDNRYGVDASMLAKNIIADALAAIRGEGVKDGE